jgi:hypothetical protein
MDFEGYVIFSGIQIVLPDNILLVNFGEKYEPPTNPLLKYVSAFKTPHPWLFPFAEYPTGGSGPHA